jgi:site-specific recombinase XerD
VDLSSPQHGDGEWLGALSGPLSTASRHQAVVILGSFFAWMVDVGYLVARNPWMLVNRRLGDDPGRSLLDNRAFTPEAWQALLRQLQAEPASASREHALHSQFRGGHRAARSELVGATLGQLTRHRGRWVMQVHGKGARNRMIAVPGQALEALSAYLEARGLGPWSERRCRPTGPCSLGCRTRRRPLATKRCTRP